MPSNLSDSQNKQVQYSMIVAHHLIKGKKVFLGSRSNRICRFCGKNSEETTFRMEAHALPEFTSNKTLIANDECDICNERFSRTIEDHFAKYLLLYRTLCQIPKKKGFPSHKDEKLRIDLKSSGLEIISALDDQVVKIEEDNKQVIIKAKRQPYVPIAIYKCLTKMAISIMPEEELMYFREAITWLNMEDHSQAFFNPIKCLFAFTPGPMPYPGVFTCLLKRKVDTDPVPYMIYIVAFGNFYFQIFVPCRQHEQRLQAKKISLGYFLVPFDTNYRYGETDYKILDLSSKELVRDEQVSMNIHYDSIHYL